MKPVALIVFLLGLAGGTVVRAADLSETDDYRFWKDTRGKSVKAKIVGVEDGKVILTPPVKNLEVPLSSLSPEDRALAEAWAKRASEDRNLLDNARLDQIFNTPVLKALRGSLHKVVDGKLEPYTIEQPAELKWVAVYYTQSHDDQYVTSLSKAYERLRRRSVAFEMVMLSFDANEAAMLKYMDDREVTFPVIDLVLAKRRVSPEIQQAFNGKIVPQLTIFDTAGQVLATSYKSDEDRVQILDTLDELEKLLRSARRGGGGDEGEATGETGG
ncbi:MAG TPA: hypothetical protein VMN36_05785 [Verrucomicrobiales bacterium]|nr:hypothetical protein [Verrucomicrobiales bacterium]